MQRMFQHGFAIGELLSDASGSTAPSADFVFALHELMLEIQLDGCAAEATKLPARLLHARSLRKDREERLGDAAAAALRPAPKHLDKEAPYRAARFAPGSFLLHAAHDADVDLLQHSGSGNGSGSGAALDYFTVGFAFIQTLLLCYRRLLDAALCQNSLAVRRFVAWDAEMGALSHRLFEALRALCDALMEQADADALAELGQG